MLVGNRALPRKPAAGAEPRQATCSIQLTVRPAPARGRRQTVNLMDARHHDAAGRVSNALSLPPKTTGHPRAGLRAGDGVLLHRDLRCDLSDIAMTARIGAGVEGARRWAAVAVFRLASLILRCATLLYHQRRISHGSLRTILSGMRVLERFGALLALGNRKKREQTIRDFRSDRVD